MPRLRQARRVLRLLGHRLGRRGRAGIDEDELRLVQSVGEAAGYAMAESNAANAYKAKTSLHNALDQILVNNAPVGKTFDDLVAEINRK